MQVFHIHKVENRVECRAGESAKSQAPPPVDQPAKCIRSRKHHAQWQRCRCNDHELRRGFSCRMQQKLRHRLPSGPGNCIAACQRTGTAGTNGSTPKKGFELTRCIPVAARYQARQVYGLPHSFRRCGMPRFGRRQNANLGSERRRVVPVVLDTGGRTWPVRQARAFVEPQTIPSRVLPDSSGTTFVGICRSVVSP